MSAPVNMLLSNLPPYKGRQKLLKGHQNTYDIVREILDKHKAWAPHYDRICLEFWKGTPEATANALYTYAKQNIPYKVEPAMKQTIKSPAAILTERFDFGNDCKHYASFIVGIGDALRRLGYPVNCFYRFASYDPRRRAPGHVFAVFKAGGKEIWVDPVPQIGGFDSRKANPAFILDKKLSMGGIGSLYEISGVPISTEQLVCGMPPDQLISGRRRHWSDDLRPGSKKVKMLVRRTKPRFLPTPPGMSGEGDIGARKKKAPGKKKGLLKKLKIKPGKFLMKFGNATQRNAFLLLVKLNTFKLATKMWQKAAKDKNSANWKKIAALWTKLGGKADKLYREIQRGVNTYNKLHKAKKRVSGIGYDDAYIKSQYLGEYIDGIDEGVGEVYDMQGAYHDDMSVGGILCFVHQNHTNRMRRAHRRRGSIGVAPAVAAAGVIAAAAPILKAFANIFKSLGINTKKGEDAAAADADNMAKEFDEGEPMSEDGRTVRTADGKIMEMTEDPVTHKQKISVKSAPGLSDGESADADEAAPGDDVQTKTKTVTKTKTWTGDNDGGGASGFLDTVKNFVTENKKYFIWGGVAILGLVVIPKVYRAVTGPAPRKRR